MDIRVLLSLTYEQGPDSKGLDSRGLVFKAFRIDTPFLRRAKQVLVINRQTLKLDRQILSRTTFFQGQAAMLRKLNQRFAYFACAYPERGYCVHCDVLGVMFREGDMSVGALVLVYFQTKRRK